MFEQEYQAAIDAINKVKQASDEFIAREELLLKAQSQLLSHVIHPDIEFSMPGLNDKPEVGGSGIGTSLFTVADGTKPALFRVAPGPIQPGQKDNYYDCYATWRTMPNPAYKNYRMVFPFSFPTSTDMTNAHCVELEARQVMAIGGVRVASVPALQANFSSGQVRYFDKAQGWVASGLTLLRQMSISIGFEAHRDDAFVYYDAITMGGQRFPVQLKEALFPLNWGERMSCSLQLDAKTKPFGIIPSKVSLEVW